MLGLHFAAYISALEYTSIAAATVLATSTPIWVGLAAPLVLGEPLTRRLKIGITVAVVGSAVIGLDSGSGGSNPLLGNLLGLSSALSGAVYFLIGRRLRPRLSLLSYTSIVYGCAALVLIVLALLGGHTLWRYSAMTLFLFLLMALFPQLLGHSSYNYALAFLPAAYVSVAIISEPIGASLLGLLIFRETPGILTIGGGALILGGIFIAGYRSAPQAVGEKLT
jgi:drug/metabolite transporter (DMT)-like permease